MTHLLERLQPWKVDDEYIVEKWPKEKQLLFWALVVPHFFANLFLHPLDIVNEIKLAGEQGENTTNPQRKYLEAAYKIMTTERLRQSQEQ